MPVPTDANGRFPKPPTDVNGRFPKPPVPIDVGSDCGKGGGGEVGKGLGKETVE